MKPKPKIFKKLGIESISIPIEIYACPALSATEMAIISNIYHLSVKYKHKGGCNLTDKELSKIHNCSRRCVTGAIAKAKSLGWIQTKKKRTTKKEDRLYYVSRRVVIIPTREWFVLKDMWNRGFIRKNEEAEKITLNVRGYFRQSVNKIGSDWRKQFINFLKEEWEKSDYFRNMYPTLFSDIKEEDEKNEESSEENEPKTRKSRSETQKEIKKERELWRFLYEDSFYDNEEISTE